ncbi:hypothetical protein GNP63_01555 [Aliivibrio fischeri]|uniref:hypothetical protein n=1 Tax=Aliivibrio fischeri TaxID=668 RepID=UPI00135DA80C|nr:hypothetical protein [Aliivibrio fischeri]MUH95238.1 hypothetical protein [Aliivibrio fischeri]MUI65466.1 hypothetical protein [Aliivibrio fischeri]
MTSYFPQWFIDLGTVLTVLGFIITLWLLWLTKDIKNSFLRRARLPQIIRELKSESTKLSSHLKKWEDEERDAIKQLSICKALLTNLVSKLPETEQKKCKEFIKKMTPRKFLIFRGKVTCINEDRAWELYTELSELTTILIQLEKDSKWD